MVLPLNDSIMDDFHLLFALDRNILYLFYEKPIESIGAIMGKLLYGIKPQKCGDLGNIVFPVSAMIHSFTQRAAAAKNLRADTIASIIDLSMESSHAIAARRDLSEGMYESSAIARSHLVFPPIHMRSCQWLLTDPLRYTIE